jgi:hypothetical protein
LATVRTRSAETAAVTAHHGKGHDADQRARSRAVNAIAPRAEQDAIEAIANDRCALCEWAADALLQRCAKLRELCR